METSLKRLCLVITLFIFMEICNGQQTTIPNSKVLRESEKPLNESIEPLRERASVKDGGASIKGHKKQHLQDLNSILSRGETTIKGQTTQPKPDGKTARNGGSLITGGLSQSVQDRTNLTNGRAEIKNLLKHVKGANLITGGKRMFIVKGKSSFNGGLWQSKQDRRKLIDRQASLRRGDKIKDTQTTRRKQDILGNGESRIKEGSRQPKQERKKLIERQEKLNIKRKGERRISEHVPQHKQVWRAITNGKPRKQERRRQSKQHIRSSIKGTSKISMSSGQSNQSRKSLNDGKGVVNGKSMPPKQKGNVFRQDMVEREKTPAQHKLKKQRLKLGETAVDELPTQKRKQRINKQKRQHQERNKSLKKGRATTKTPHKQSKQERIVLQNGETMVRKPKKVRLRRIYRTMNVYYQKGMTLDEARTRSKYVDNVVRYMEKENTTQVISKGKHIFLNGFLAIVFLYEQFEKELMLSSNSSNRPIQFGVHWI